jgi:acyl-CoA synthetase (NDP forming)
MATVAKQARAPIADLGRLLAPRSIAVVGASERRSSYGELICGNLRRADFPGTVWGINPGREQVYGFPCLPTLAELPEPVDAVVIAIPAAGVAATVDAAGALGCGGAIVISAGFGEIAAGHGLDADLRAAAARHRLPVCGPNGNGIAALHARAPMWGDAIGGWRAGHVALITQSGNVGVNALGAARGIDFHTVISTGNQAVVDASDWLDALADSEGVRSVGLFLEAAGEGSKLAAALSRCAERGVGVAIQKVGASPAGARAAAAHTGSLAGDVRVFRSLVEEAGAAWAEEPHELLELARAMAAPKARAREPGGVAVLTCSGGDSGSAADIAASVGVEMPALADQTKRRLEPLLPSAATVDNPLDYTAMIWGDVEALSEMTLIVSDDPGIAQVLLLFDYPDRPLDASWDAVLAGIIAGGKRASSAVIAAATLPDLINEDAARELAGHGIPYVAGLGEAIRCAKALSRPPGDPARLSEIAAAAAPRPGPEGADPEWLDEAEAKSLLAQAGVAVPEGRRATDPEGAAAEAEALGFPVAIKLVARGLIHKSEAGALRLGLATGEEVRVAAAELLALEQAGSAGPCLLVERMVEGEAELVVAAHRDGVVPALVVGLGGIWAEALDDVAVVPLPADPQRVEAALRSLRAAALLTGGRGRAPLDLPAAAALASRVGRLLLDADLDLIELNPVRLGVRGAVALDAVISRRSDPGE